MSSMNRDGRTPRRRRSCGVAISALVGLVAGLVLLWHPASVAARLVFLLPEVFPSIPVRPLLLTPAPTRREVRYAGVEGTIAADLYQPAGEGRHGAVLLFLGVNPVGRDEPILVRVAEGLARTGLVVLIPESDRLNHGEISIEEVDDIVAGIEYLSTDRSVDSARVGLTGFSVGGSLTLLAAADARVAGKLTFVNAFGAYADGHELAAAVVARAFELDGQVVPWAPEPMAERVVIEHFLSIVPSERERNAIRQAVELWRATASPPSVRVGVDGPAPGSAEPGHGPSTDPGGERGTASPVVAGSPGQASAERLGIQSQEGRAVLGFLTANTLPEARERLQLLPEEARVRLRRLSPIERVGALRTRVFLMHDVDDPLVPFVESRRLAAALAGTSVVFTEFAIFEHVEPRKAVDILTLAGQAAKLFGHLYQVLLPVLD